MEYEPYGKEWEKDMMQMTKKELIEFIRTILKKNKLDNDWGGMMKGKGKKCKSCKNYLEYEQVQGMRLVFIENGKKVYHTYCSTCKIHSTEKKPWQTLKLW